MRLRCRWVYFRAVTAFGGVKAGRAAASGRARGACWCWRPRFRSRGSSRLHGSARCSFPASSCLLYLALATWGAALIAGWLAGDRDRPDGYGARRAAHRAVAAFALVFSLSAVFAPASRGAAFKFALRSAGGMLLYAAAADLLRAPGAVARTAKALVAGRSSRRCWLSPRSRAARSRPSARPVPPRRPSRRSASRARAARFSIRTSPRCTWRRSRRSPSRSGSSAAPPRAGESGERRLRVGWSRLVPRSLLLDGVLATASRAGLSARWSRWRRSAFSTARARRACAGGGGAGDGAAGGGAGFELGAGRAVSLLARRRLVPRRRSRRRAGAAGRLPPVLAPASAVTESLEVAEPGSAPLAARAAARWRSRTTGWTRPRARWSIFDGAAHLASRRHLHGRPLRESARLVRAPARPGRYVLWWDLVHEHTTWFSERGNAGLREEVVVRGDAPGRALRRPSAHGGGARFLRGRPGMPRHTLWRAAFAAFRAHPLLGIGPDNFRHRSGAFLGLAPTPTSGCTPTASTSRRWPIWSAGGCWRSRRWWSALVGGRAARGRARRRRRVPGPGRRRRLGTYLLHGALDYFLEFTPTYALFWLLAGMIVALDRSGGEVAA